MSIEDTLADESLALGGDGGSDGSEGDKKVSLKDLGKAMGAEFGSEEDALKAIKNTKSFVGAKKEDIVSKVVEQLRSETAPTMDRLKQLEEDNFFATHNEYSAPEVKSLIKDLAKDGTPFSKVVEGESFKNVFEKVKALDESVKSKSVLQTNPRIGAVNSNMDEAQEAFKAGNPELAAKKAVSAVIETFGLDKK